MAKIFVEAYGCSASFADSEMISGLIINGGHTLATEFNRIRSQSHSYLFS